MLSMKRQHHQNICLMNHYNYCFDCVTLLFRQTNHLCTVNTEQWPIPIGNASTSKTLLFLNQRIHSNIAYPVCPRRAPRERLAPDSLRGRLRKEKSHPSGLAAKPASSQPAATKHKGNYCTVRCVLTHILKLHSTTTCVKYQLFWHYIDFLLHHTKTYEKCNVYNFECSQIDAIEALKIPHGPCLGYKVVSPIDVTFTTHPVPPSTLPLPPPAPQRS